MPDSVVSGGVVSAGGGGDGGGDEPPPPPPLHAANTKVTITPANAGRTGRFDIFIIVSRPLETLKTTLPRVARF
jgi:hypothetical protein